MGCQVFFAAPSHGHRAESARRPWQTFESVSSTEAFAFDRLRLLFSASGALTPRSVSPRCAAASFLIWGDAAGESVSTWNDKMSSSLTTAMARVEIRSPLVCGRSAATILGITRERLQVLVESGDVPWAFDLRTEYFNRCELRILAECLADHQAGDSRRTAALSFREVIDRVFPIQAFKRDVATISLAVLARKLSCGADHMTNLVQSRQLQPMPGSIARRGPGGSLLLSFASVETFLKRRRIR